MTPCDPVVSRVDRHVVSRKGRSEGCQRDTPLKMTVQLGHNHLVEGCALPTIKRTEMATCLQEALATAQRRANDTQPRMLCREGSVNAVTPDAYYAP